MFRFIGNLWSRLVPLVVNDVLSCDCHQEGNCPVCGRLHMSNMSAARTWVCLDCGRRLKWSSANEKS